MRVRRQTAIDELDAPAIEELAVGTERDEHRRATVLGDADGSGPPRSLSRHVVSPAAVAIARSVSWSHDSRHIYSTVAETQTDVVLLDGLL